MQAPSSIGCMQPMSPGAARTGTCAPPQLWSCPPAVSCGRPAEPSVPALPAASEAAASAVADRGSSSLSGRSPAARRAARSSCARAIWPCSAICISAAAMGRARRTSCLGSRHRTRSGHSHRADRAAGERRPPKRLPGRHRPLRRCRTRRAGLLRRAARRRHATSAASPAASRTGGSAAPIFAAATLAAMPPGDGERRLHGCRACRRGGTATRRAARRPARREAKGAACGVHSRWASPRPGRRLAGRAAAATRASAHAPGRRDIGARVQQDIDKGWLCACGVRVEGRDRHRRRQAAAHGRFNLYRASGGQRRGALLPRPRRRRRIASSTGGSAAELAGGFTLALGDSTSLYARARQAMGRGRADARQVLGAACSACGSGGERQGAERKLTSPRSR